MAMSMREVFKHQGISGERLSFRQLLGTLPFVGAKGLRDIFQRLELPEFPENQVEISRQYLGENPREKVEEVRSALRAVLSFRGIQERAPRSHVLLEQNAAALRRDRARRLLLRPDGFLDQLAEILISLNPVYEHLRTHAFGAAEEKIKIDNFPPELRDLTVADIEEAFAANDLSYMEIIIQHPSEPDPQAQGIEIISRTLEGYRGFVLDARVTHELVAGGPERDFRLGLLNAEISLGKRNYDAAICHYSTLLTATPLGSPRHKFVALRAAFAHLARGDSLFRKSRTPDEGSRKQSRAAYVDGMRLVQDSGIAPDNPRRQQIERYAAVQIGKLDAGLNFIGYRDSYVPIIKPEVLQGLAERRIARATAAIEKFEFFTSKADQLQDEIDRLDFEGEIKAIDNEITAQRVANANDKKRIASERINQISSQLHALDISLGIEIGSSILQGVAAGFLAGQPGGVGAGEPGGAGSGEPGGVGAGEPGGVGAGEPGGVGIALGTNTLGVAGAIGGLASAIAGYCARKDDLKSQKKIAEIESGVATRDVEIAELEQRIIGRTLEFLGEKIERIKNRELNPDLYYTAAEDFRALAERHLDAAIHLAYLFERAVAFLRLKPELQVIRFDYLPLEYVDDRGNRLTAAERLAADLEDVVSANLPITKFHFLTETYSLRLSYPIEFSRFLQTGDMDFTLSLYELNKLRPGVWRQRIKHLDVEVIGLIPITGYTGRIIHRGSFLLRDKDTTPEPGAGRFIPTDDQLAHAFEELKNGATQGVPIAGVMPFLLDEDRLELSPHHPPSDLHNPAPEALFPIEGYGPAGNWRLEIEHIDLRQITDVLLRVTYVIPESDGALARRVKGLIATYEQQDLSPADRLDLITPFSLSKQFGDVFFQLAEGQAHLLLRREDFPSGDIADLKLKTVVVQALDQQKHGVAGLALEIARPGTTLNLARTTRTDGFSEDVTAPIPFLPRDERFPVEGAYTLRLPDPGQASRLDDLLLFIIYEYREV
jgi:hypothetical protein